MRFGRTLVAVWVILVLATACGKEEAAPAARARPVTVITMASETPVRDGDMVGVAESFREEAIGLEVAGRVLFAARLGSEVQGPVLDAAGAISEGAEGSVLATLDTTRYELAARSAKLSLDASKSTLKTREVDATVAAPAEVSRSKAQAAAAKEEISAAQADVKARQAAFQLAKENLAREQSLNASGSGTEQDLDNAQRDFDSAEARLTQSLSVVDAKTQSYNAAQAAVSAAEANLNLKAAKVAEARAEVARLENEVARAQQDLHDCTLHAPFTGRVTREIVGRGGIVASGQPVLHLTMMDPIKLVATVTGEQSRMLPSGRRVRATPSGVSLPGGVTELSGTVIGKPEVADAATRTFRVEILVRNRNRAGGGDQGTQLIRNVMPVLRRDPAGNGPLHVAADAVFEDAGKSWVLRLVKAADEDRNVLEVGKVYKPERVEVQRTGRFFTIVSWNFAEIASGSGLEPRDILVLNPTPDSEKGISIAGYDWLIRPGDLVPLNLDMGELQAGFYVPIRAIRNLNGRTSVLVVGAGNEAEERVVTVHETWRDRRRVEGVSAGDRVVVDGLHYVASGDAVNPTQAESGAGQ